VVLVVLVLLVLVVQFDLMSHTMNVRHLPSTALHAYMEAKVLEAAFIY